MSAASLKTGISEETFHIWKKKNDPNLGGSELREPRQLRAEDAKSKIEAWQEEYNDRRTQSSRGHLTSSDYVEKGQTKRTEAGEVLFSIGLIPDASALQNSSDHGATTPIG